MLNGFWEGKCGTNMGSTGKGNAGGKGSTWGERVEGCKEVRWNGHAQQDFGRGSMGMWNETQAKQEWWAEK